MSENGHTHFKNLAAFCCKIFKVSDHFGTLCIKGVKGRDGVKAKVYIYCFYDVIPVERNGVSENCQIRAYVFYGWSLSEVMELVKL